MRARTIVILAVVIFLLGGAIGALYAVLSANTPSANEDLPVSTYDELKNNEENNQDNNQDNDEDAVNNGNGCQSQQTDQNNEDLNQNDENNSQDNSQTSTNDNQEEHRVGEVNVREDSALSLRQGPGTNYERIGQVYRGDQLDILEEQNGWYKVQTYDGVEAWVSAEYVNIIEQ